MKIKLICFIMMLLAIFIIASPTFLSAKPLKIGVVDLNKALNGSEKGIRFKNRLESKGRRKSQELKLEEDELKKLAKNIQNNPLLTQKARTQKQNEFKEKQYALANKAKRYQQEIRSEERQLTQSMFKELRAAIRTVSIKNKFDIVLEKNASQIILYMKFDRVDITQKVIDYYNQLKSK